MAAVIISHTDAAAEAAAKKDRESVRELADRILPHIRDTGIGEARDLLLDGLACALAIGRVEGISASGSAQPTEVTS